MSNAARLPKSRRYSVVPRVLRSGSCFDYGGGFATRYWTDRSDIVTEGNVRKIVALKEKGDALFKVPMNAVVAVGEVYKPIQAIPQHGNEK